MPQNAARLNELLDQVRNEFDQQVRLNEGYEQQSESTKHPQEEAVAFKCASSRRDKKINSLVLARYKMLMTMQSNNRFKRLSS